MPLYQLLTDRTLAEASAITPTTLIHIVTTADTRQNIAGSSYKAELGQLAGLFSGSTFSGGSGNCITDLYVSNIHSCSPLNINPLDEGNVYFGSTSGITIDLTNNRVGIGTNQPQYRLDISGTTGRLFYDSDSILSQYRASTFRVLGSSTGNTEIALVQDDANGANGLSLIYIGTGTTNTALNRGYGGAGDAAMFATSAANNLNIINTSSSATSDNIRFYAGAGGLLSSNTPDIHIQGSGSTKGYVGIGTTTPGEKLHIDQGRLRLDETWQITWLSTAGTQRARIFGDGGSNFIIETGASNTEKLRVTGTGLVGIGTPSPTAQLHVNNTGSTNSFLVEDSTNPDSSPFVIDSSGNVGIGISGTTYKLDVNGTTIHRDNVQISNSKEIFWSDTSTTWPTSINNRIRWTLNNDSAQVYAFQPESDDIDFVFKITDNATTSTDNYVFWIDDTVGEANDRYPLEMNGQNFIVNPTRRYALSASTSASSVTNFYVLKSGATSTSSSILHANTSTDRVGVNTSSPSETLDVNGKTKTINFQMTSGATDGYVLSSIDNSGNATWGNLSSLYTGNTSGDCIADLYITNLHGCSPITVHDTMETVTGIIRTSGGTGAELNLKDSFGPNGTWSITSDNGGYTSGSTWVYGQPNNGVQIAYQIDNYPGEAIGVGIYNNVNDTLFTGKEIVISNNKINSRNTGTSDRRAVFIGSKNSTINSGVVNSVVIGGSSIVATDSNKVYVSALNIDNIGTGTSINNLGIDVNGNVVTGTTGGGGTFTGGTVSGTTNFTNGLTATTVSATTYQNLPISGTHNYLSKFSSGSTILVDSQIRDNGSTVGLGIPPNVNAKLYVATSSEPYGLGAENQATNGVGVFGQAAALGNTTGVAGLANGTATSNIGVNGQANEATTNIGLRGYAFNGTNNYSIQLLDGTEGIGKVLTSVTSDGKANWQTLPSATFTGGTVSGATNFTNGLTANTISATTYYNLPAKEVFYKSHSANEALVDLGRFFEPAYNGGVSPVYISGIIPYDFGANISSEIILISTASETETISLNFSSGSVGGSFSATTGTTSFPKTYTQNIIDTVNVDNFFSGITANQVFSLDIYDNGNYKLVIGIKFKYKPV